MSVALIAHYLGPKLGVGQYFDRLLPPLVEELTTREINPKIWCSPNTIHNSLVLQKIKDQVCVLPQLDYSPRKRYTWFALNFSRYCYQEKVKAVVWLSNPIILPWHPAAIAVIHDVNEWKVKNKYGDRLKTALRSAIYLDASLRFAKRIITVSRGTQNDLLHFRPDPLLKLKVTMIPNGSDCQLINLPSVPITTPASPFLLSVGRIDPVAKRLPEAVKLVSILREASGEAWELQLVGGMNASTQQAGEEFLKSIEDLPWVKYHGYVDDYSLAEWYRKATAVVFLSDFEGFGLPIAEAASFGRKVIVSSLNQTSMEAGGSAIIPVDIDRLHEAALEVLNRLREWTLSDFNNDLPNWQSTGRAYAEEIASMLSSYL